MLRCFTFAPAIQPSSIKAASATFWSSSAAVTSSSSGLVDGRSLVDCLFLLHVFSPFHEIDGQTIATKSHLIRAIKPYTISSYKNVHYVCLLMYWLLICWDLRIVAKCVRQNEWWFYINFCFCTAALEDKRQKINVFLCKDLYKKDRLYCTTGYTLETHENK
jgi:hypothetical protein